MSICPIPIDTEGSLDLYIYCNPSRTEKFLYSLVESPTVNGFTINTVLYKPKNPNEHKEPKRPNGSNKIENLKEPKEYYKVVSISKDYPDNVYLYNSFFRFESSPCDMWSIVIGSTVLQCSLPEKPDEYHVIDGMCDSSAWSYLGLFKTVGYGPMSSNITLAHVLSSSNGHKITFMANTTISLGDSTTSIAYYGYTYDDAVTVGYIDPSNTVQQGTAYVVRLPPGTPPNNSIADSTVGMGTKESSSSTDYIFNTSFGYTITEVDSNNNVIPGVKPAYGRGSTIGFAGTFGKGTHRCQIVVTP